MNLRVLIVDDEPPARRRLSRMLVRLPDVVVVGEAGDGIAALECIRSLQPDVVLLDIRMPGLDGLALASQEPNLPPIIFTTAYDEYAVRAFEANAVDYLLKPIEAERLAAALIKVKSRSSSSERLAGLLQDLLQSQTPARITARSGNVLRVFDAQDIPRFRATDRYTVFKHDGREFVLDESLATLESRLPRFLRVHRAELVNLDSVRALRLEPDGCVVELADGQIAPVSRRLVPELKRRLGMLA